METDNIKSRIEDVEKILEEYNQKLYLDRIKLKEIDLDYNVSIISSMACEDIYKLCLDLSYYGLGLQKEVNKIKQRMIWTEQNLNKRLSILAAKEQGYGFEEKKAKALSGDEYSQKLYDLKTKCMLHLTSFDFIVNKIDFISKLAMSIAEAKKKEEYNYKKQERYE